MSYRSWFSSWVRSVFKAFAGGMVRWGGMLISFAGRLLYREEKVRVEYFEWEIRSEVVSGEFRRIWGKRNAGGFCVVGNEQACRTISRLSEA